MKTRIILLAFLFLMILQNTEAQVKYGLRAGANLETQAKMGVLWNNVDLYQGYTLGMFAEYRRVNNFSMEAELNYQKKGEKIESEETILRNEFNYLSLPVLAKGNFDFGSNEEWSLNLFAGPYFSYLVSVFSSEKSDDIVSHYNLNDEVNKTDAGMILGGGVTFNLPGGSAIIADLRYQMGLCKVYNMNHDLRNKGAGITIGYRF
jgi:hypothetical protein